MIEVYMQQQAGEVFSAFNTPFLDGMIKRFDLEKVELHDDGSVRLTGIIDVEASAEHPGDIEVKAQSSFSFILVIKPDGETDLTLPDEIEVKKTICKTRTHKREDIPGGLL